MRIGIMQPYLFPYLGYFQLINAVDKFVLLDDVHYINKGWINRNRLLINGEPRLFTVPLEHASQNRLIKDISVAPDMKWKSRTLKTIEGGYRKAPHFNQVLPMVEEVINANESSISGLVHFSLQCLLKYMNIATEIVPSSAVYQASHLKGQDRILEICYKEQAGEYLNPIGGTDLYCKSEFEKKNVKLQFIRPNLSRYEQRAASFTAGLSVVDVLMNNSKEETARLLLDYSIV